jgi:hypothetical protein
MADTDESFNATGPTVVAFETVSLDWEDVPAFGVAVYGSQCAVNGVQIAETDNTADPQRIGPDGVGVHGLGHSEGVQGEGPVGVHGIGKDPGLIGTGVGVQGDGAGIGVQGEGPIGVRGKGGVIGVDGAGNTGVQGTGTLVGVEGAGSTGVHGKGDVGAHGEGRTGVHGRGDMTGVLGECRSNRAGVFHTGRDPLPLVQHSASDPSAQILLAAVNVDGLVQDSLPRAGLAGDLFAVIGGDQRQQRTAELWFCIRTGSNDPSQPGATWAQVQFATTVTVP